MKKSIQPLLYIVSLIACCIEVDISVPSFPGLVESLNTTQSLAQYTVSINFLGCFISALLVGPLADAYGRRPIMVIGNAILMLGAIGCVIAPTISTLLLARFIQGLGAATSAVVVFAMIADTYSGQKATKLIGFMNCALTCLMAASPIAGSYLNEHFGWQGTYTTVAIISVFSWILLLAVLTETIASKTSLTIKNITNGLTKMLKSREFLKASIAPSLLYAAYLSFITCASFLYMQTYNLPMFFYAIHQFAIVGVFALVSLSSGWILKYIGSSKCISLGIFLSIFGVGSFLFTSAICPSAILTTISVSLFSIGSAIFYPVVFSASLEIFPNTKASATSLIMAKRAVIVAFSTWITGYFYSGEPMVIAIVMLVLVAVAATLTSRSKQFIKC